MTEQQYLLMRLQLHTRIAGGAPIMMALDRLACPSFSKRGTRQMQEAMKAILEFSQSMEPGDRKALQDLIAGHMKIAMTKKNEVPASQAIDEKEEEEA